MKGTSRYPYGAADLDYHDVGTERAQSTNTLFDLVGDVGNTWTVFPSSHRGVLGDHVRVHRSVVVLDILESDSSMNRS